MSAVWFCRFGERLLWDLNKETIEDEFGDKKDEIRHNMWNLWILR